jgi:hypothetical protein
VSGQLLYYAVIQLALGIVIYIVSLIENPVLYWILGSLLCFVSLLISVYILHQKTSLWAALISKFKGRFHRHA